MLHRSGISLLGKLIFVLTQNTPLNRRGQHSPAEKESAPEFTGPQEARTRNTLTLNARQTKHNTSDKQAKEISK